MQSALAVASVLALAVACGACEERTLAKPDAAVGTETRPDAGATIAHETASLAPPLPRPPAALVNADGGSKPCLVMSSEGGPAPTADATSWLDVGAKAHFSVRTIETGRELRFEGPG